MPLLFQYSTSVSVSQSQSSQSLTEWLFLITQIKKQIFITLIVTKKFLFIYYEMLKYAERTKQVQQQRQSTSDKRNKNICWNIEIKDGID